MFLHFRRHLALLDMIIKFALYVGDHRNGEGCQRKFDFLALTVFTDDMAALPVLLIVKIGNRPVKGINNRFV